MIDYSIVTSVFTVRTGALSIILALANIGAILMAFYAAWLGVKKVMTALKDGTRIRYDENGFDSEDGYR